MGEIDEAELLSAGQRGAVLDGMADGRKRILPAAVLRRCCRELKDQIDPRGLRLTNAVVTGELDLTGLVVPFSLRFDECEFDACPRRRAPLPGAGTTLRSAKKFRARPDGYLRSSMGPDRRRFACGL